MKIYIFLFHIFTVFGNINTFLNMKIGRMFFFFFLVCGQFA